MILRVLTAFLLLPGVVAFLFPLIFVSFDPWRNEVFYPGVAILLLGILLLLWCVWNFYASGEGTLAPWDPPQKLVIVGLYRYVRNPMYVSVMTMLSGWSLFFLSPVLVVYTAIIAVAFHIRVVMYEEPWLAERFGDEWQHYRNTVSRWIPGFR